MRKQRMGLRKGLIVWSVFLFFSLKLQAQSKDIPISIPSPNVASLGEFLERPVSFYSGQPEISIPLYNVQGKHVSLPLSLRYNASGLRPEIHPSWVGNGWGLSAGGVITRVVNGDIDERSVSFARNQGYYFNYNQLNNTTWSSNSVLSKNVAFPNPNTSVSFDVDVEPDEFVFSLPGYSGKFFLDHNGQWQVQCDRPMKVIFNSTDFVDPFILTAEANVTTSGVSQSNVSKTFGRFTIIDEKGNKYVFGGTDRFNSAIEFSDVMIPQGQRGSSITATSWYLTKIISADETEVINLGYERGPLTSVLAYHYSAIGMEGNSQGQLDPAYMTSSYESGLRGRVIFPVYLKSISIPGQGVDLTFGTSKSNELPYSLNGSTINAYAKVYTDAKVSASNFDFPSFYAQTLTSSSIIPYYANNTPPDSYHERFIWLKLDNITIKNSSGNLRSLNFNYDEDANTRLKLTSVVFKGNTGTTAETYAFSYDATPLPKYLETMTDHWGYNNNISIANFGSNLNFEQFRAVDITGLHTKAESLVSITYPTGGSSKFFYEPNAYSSVVYRNNGPTLMTENGIGGGLRLKRSINTDCAGRNVVHSYYYIKGFRLGLDTDQATSSGILDSKPVYAYSTTGKDVSGHDFTGMIVNSNPIIPLTSTSAGSMVGYSEVVDMRNDGAFTVYKFTNYDNGFSDPSHVNSYNRPATSIFPGTSIPFIRGRMMEKKDYDINGQPVSRESIGFQSNPYVAAPSSRAVFSNTYYSSISGGRAVVSRTAYLLYYFPFNPVSGSRVYYDQKTADSVVYETDYNYNTYGLLSKESSIDSKSDVVEKSYRYPTDYSDAVSQGMVGLHILSPVVETVTKVAGDVQLTQRTNFYSPHDKMYLPQEVQLKIRDKSFETKYRFNRHDSHGNILEEQEADGPKRVYLWGYNKMYPVAKIEGADYDTVNSEVSQEQIDEAVADGVSGLRALISGLRLNTVFKNALINGYAYKPNVGMIEETGPEGLTAFYSYDHYGRLKTIKDHENNLVQDFHYNYAGAIECSLPQMYTNVRRTQSFAVSNCSSGTGSFIYVVPASKYVSFISQEDANQLADNEIAMNGQKHADRYGTCQLQITFNVSNNSSVMSGSFMISIDGINKTGPRTVASGVTNSIVCGGVDINSNANVSFSFLSVPPSSVSISGYWGQKTASVSGNVASFTGINLSTVQSITVKFN